MAEFLKLENYKTAIQKFLVQIAPCAEFELLDTKKAFGRITFENIKAEETIPAFDRSAVDGYAVMADDTFGASDTMPMFFRCVGEVQMGKEPSFSLHHGEAAVIHTGGMLPQNSDAVVMIENTELIRTNEIEVHRAVSMSENIILKGEDIEKGETIIHAGSMLRAVEIGGCLAQGTCQVKVIREITIGIISTGDELVPAEKKIALGQVREINSSILELIIRNQSGRTKNYGIIPDQIDLLRDAVRKAYHECDLVIITAGSSISERDNTSIAVSELGEPGILVHGINIKPGKPTILAVCGGKPVIGLPGNPVSAFVVANLVVIPAVHRLQGLVNERIENHEFARLTINVTSQAGRYDFVPVKLHENDGELLAEPIFYKSNLIFSLVQAQALAVIPEDSNGVNVNGLVRIIRL